MEDKITERVRTRFWKRVQKSEEPDACWIYISRSNKKPHIFFITVDKSRSEYYATRVSKFLSGCKVTGKIVYRTCMTPNCVNPDHLAVGTHQDVANTLKEHNISVGRKPKPVVEPPANPLLVTFD